MLVERRIVGGERESDRGEMDVVRKIPALLSRATFLMRTNSDKLDLGKFRDFLYSSTIMVCPLPCE
jgi:hypothetical protein